MMNPLGLSVRDLQPPPASSASRITAARRRTAPACSPTCRRPSSTARSPAPSTSAPRLAGSKYAKRCFMRQAFRFFAGREETMARRLHPGGHGDRLRRERRRVQRELLIALFSTATASSTCACRVSGDDPETLPCSHVVNLLTHRGSADRRRACLGGAPRADRSRAAARPTGDHPRRVVIFLEGNGIRPDCVRDPLTLETLQGYADKPIESNRDYGHDDPVLVPARAAQRGALARGPGRRRRRHLWSSAPAWCSDCPRPDVGGGHWI